MSTQYVSTANVVENIPDLKEFIQLLKEMDKLKQAEVKGYMKGMQSERKTA